ncbi:Outer membrane protein TolC [Dyadobacter sp. SG02]|uniref:TolC family protein n=1 Tax=Dyadobacter sp. SG02 TaxID=1855291 RepID=UPI0008B919AF|nr:TolC family protein [Dyadobacter sp. SG02]SEJ02917.1 Outer membrane protein TolC [Dyadobacter sp. SG02]
MKTKQILPILTLCAMAIASAPTYAQQAQPLTLEQAVEMALQNNHLLNVRKLQVAEKEAKVAEDAIKRYPVASVSSSYQYNANLGQLVIEQGSFGALPLVGTTIALPNEEKTFPLGKHHNFNAGVTLYQPITQLGKIKTGIEVAKTDAELARHEQSRAALQIRQAIEKLYYGLLITQKQQDEANAKIRLAQMRLYDVESALLSGKTIDVNKAGLQANIADEEQNLLKLRIQTEDYTADLKQLTGIEADSVTLATVASTAGTAATVAPGTLDSYLTNAATANNDIKIASLTEIKTQKAIRAAEQSNLPDIGLVAGYSYQTGNLLFPNNNPFVGAQFKWNIQDLVANKQVIRQRQFLSQQARENLVNTQNQVKNDISKTHRKLTQATALIAVAEKAVKYRSEELKVQTDKQAFGLNLEADILNTRSLLAKAEADLLAAQLNYRLAYSDLQRLASP